MSNNFLYYKYKNFKELRDNFVPTLILNENFKRYQGSGYFLDKIINIEVEDLTFLDVNFTKNYYLKIERKLSSLLSNYLSTEKILSFLKNKEKYFKFKDNSCLDSIELTEEGLVIFRINKSDIVTKLIPDLLLASLFIELWKEWSYEVKYFYLVIKRSRYSNKYLEILKNIYNMKKEDFINKGREDLYNLFEKYSEIKPFYKYGFLKRIRRFNEIDHENYYNNIITTYNDVIIYLKKTLYKKINKAYIEHNKTVNEPFILDIKEYKQWDNKLKLKDKYKPYILFIKGDKKLCK